MDKHAGRDLKLLKDQAGSIMKLYSLTQKRHCKPVIISISSYDYSRESQEKDVTRLTEVFNKLSFDPPNTMFKNSKKKCILDGLIELRENKEYIKDVDFFLCVILSHGSHGCFKDVEGDDISIDEIVHIFNNESCSGLRGKPKIFIIQSDDDAIHLTDPSQFGYTSGVDVFIPEMADIFIYQSYIPGAIELYNWSQESIELRWDITQGSKFIQTVCNILISKPDTEIHELATQVNKEIIPYIERIRNRKFEDRENRKELSKQPSLPVCTSQLREEFYFNQRIKEPTN